MLPDTLRGYEIPAGDYAFVTFSAPDVERVTCEALMPGYDELYSWINNSDEWETIDAFVAYEVYDDNRFEVASWPEMDIWAQVKRKNKKNIAVTVNNEI